MADGCFSDFSAKSTKKVPKNLANDGASEYTITVNDLRLDSLPLRQEGEIVYAERKASQRSHHRPR
ncbi:MAG: hypothetical protein ACLTZJ_05750 [Oscillospiraceae bacterium]